MLWEEKHERKKRRTDVNYSAALYMRLSKDDVWVRAAVLSIRKNAEHMPKHRYMVYDEYIDDELYPELHLIVRDSSV